MNDETGSSSQGGSSGSSDAQGAAPTNPTPDMTQQSTPPPGATQPMYGAPQTPQAPPQYGQMPPQGGYPPPQGGYAPPPQGYPQGAYPPQGYQQPYQQPYAPVAMAPAKSGVPAIVWILGAILVFFIACGLIAYFTIFAAGRAIVGGLDTLGASAVAFTFDADISSGDYQGAHDQLSGDIANRYPTATLQSKWEALMKSGSSSGTSNTGTPRTEGDKIVVPWTLKTANGNTINIDLYVTSASSGANALKIVDAKPDLIPSP